MNEQDELLLTELKEIVLGIRQYLCNTEFAPEPFTKPINPEKLTVDFPKQILAKVLKHRLDRPALREKIAQALYLRYSTSAVAPNSRLLLKWEILGEDTKKGWREDADYVLALILPDIEEAKAQYVTKLELLSDELEVLKLKAKKLNKKLNDREEDLIEAKREERWNVGEDLCILIGNKMLEDTKAGELLGEQLRDYMNNYLKVGVLGKP